MKKLIPILLSALMLTGCAGAGNQTNSYRQISMDEAVTMMAEESGYIILDVRTPEEFAEKHIPNAINVPNETIGTDEISQLPDKNQLIMVYCRSGRRSKEAAEKLVKLGYTNIVEFGGIIDWKPTKQSMTRKENYFLKTQERSSPKNCRISTLFAADSLVKAFQSLESEGALKMPEERFSLRSLGLPELKDLHFCSLKTFPDCYLTTAAGRLRPSSVRFRNWGTMSHGRFLTAQISVFPNPEKECFLSAVLEKNAPERYYLSPIQIQKLLFKSSAADKVTESTDRKD